MCSSDLGVALAQGFDQRLQLGFAAGHGGALGWPDFTNAAAMPSCAADGGGSLTAHPITRPGGADPRPVLLCGYYGEHNLGDDALLEALLSQLPAGVTPLPNLDGVRTTITPNSSAYWGLTLMTPNAGNANSLTYYTPGSGPFGAFVTPVLGVSASCSPGRRAGCWR